MLELFGLVLLITLVWVVRDLNRSHDDLYRRHVILREMYSDLLEQQQQRSEF